MDFSWNNLADPKFCFHDHSLVEVVREGNPQVQAFFRLLALCHTVMPEEKKEGEKATPAGFTYYCIGVGDYGWRLEVEVAQWLGGQLLLAP